MFGSVIINQVTNGHDFLQLSWSAASQALFTCGDTSGDFVVSMDAFPAGTFYHVAGTYDGTAYRLFVNGKLEGALNSTSPVSYSNGGWNIGGNISAQENFRTWNGVIDEVQAFNRALSQSELQAIFNAGSAGSASSFCKHGWRRRQRERFRRIYFDCAGNVDRNLRFESRLRHANAGPARISMA